MPIDSMMRLFRDRFKHHYASFIVAGIVLTLTISCDISKKYQEAEFAAINDYLNDNPDFNFELKPSGLYYSEIKPGTGTLAYTNDTAYLKYTAMLLDSTIFETNIRDDNTFDTMMVPVSNNWLLPGLYEGLTYMREGGESLLLLPSTLAFGSNSHPVYASEGYWVIRGFTPILINVELVKLKPGP